MNRLNPAVLSRRNSKHCVGFFLAVSLAICTLLLQGCSVVPQSAATSTDKPAQGRTVLPSSYVGSSYRAAVAGGSHLGAAHLTEGALPPGLVLDATSTISGVPTKEGTFTFTIASGADIRGTPAIFGYSLTVQASPAINVQISPTAATFVPSAKVQFYATVKNTSNTAVTWSASAGTISSTGLWTAPASTTLKSIAIIATSAANPAESSSATVSTVTSTFKILTTTLPAAVASTAYSASLVGTGGQGPYQWSIASGSLPAGLRLDAASGIVSGLPSKAGTSTFSVQATDAIAETSQKSYSILVSSTGMVCGPPTYNCSRTDSEVVQISQVPNVGNLSGANTVVTDPDFRNRIARVTDWNTDPGLQPVNRSFVSASSGSSDENLWNTDSSMFIIQNMGAGGYPYTFDASSMRAQLMYNGTVKVPGGGMWSRVSRNVLYVASDIDTSISKYDFSDRTNPPSPQLVYNFASGSNCLPAGFTQTWKTKGGVSAGDSVFGMGYSNAGDQGTGIYALAYKVGSGCTVLNTKTGQVWGDWGLKGTINIPDRWLIHNVKVTKDGNWLIVATAGCLVSTCSNGPYFWQIGTLNVSSCGNGLDGGQRCSGHWTEGYSHWMNNYDAGHFTTRPLADPTQITYVTPDVPLGIQDPLDQHASWNNADPADSVPFFLTFWSLTNPFPGPWYNEITGVAPDGSGKVWRFAHSFITTRSQIFNAEYGIGSVSQDGRFFIFSSDWMGTLGSQSGSPTCTIGKDCRGDVFVLELK